mmetsp:Transcript_8399/g.17367  ORF Transcript_8399/g.17367 Transcript_8399/m.17367 type:complete len:131 (-) Transcript_8399:218-610(-)
MYGAGQVLIEDHVGPAHCSPIHRPDLTVLDAAGVGAHMLVEVTVFWSSAAGNQRARHRPAGSALLARQEERRQEYGAVAPHRLVLFAVTDYGMLSRDVRALLRECTAMRGDRLDVEGRLSTWLCRTFSAF